MISKEEIKVIKRILSVVMVVLLAFGTAAPIMTANPMEAAAADTGEWVAAWGTGMTEASLDTISNLLTSSGDCTVRIVVRPTVSGNKVRFKLSNKFGDTSLTVNRMTVAKVSTGSSISTGTIKQVTYNNGRIHDMIIPAGQEVYTDAMNFTVKANEEIALSLYFSKSEIGEMPNITTSGFSGGSAYVAIGNKTHEEVINTSLGPITLPSEPIGIGTAKAVPLLSDVDVYSNESDPYSVVVVGDETVANNLNGYLGRLVYAEGADGIGVIGKGVIGNCLIADAGAVSGDIYGKSLLNRMWDDVVNVENVRYAIVKIGVNDIVLGGYNTEEMIRGFETFIKRCHENDIKVIACSITPWKNAERNYFGINGEPQYVWREADWKTAEDVNRWLASTDMLDGYVDLNAVTASLRDPQKFRDEKTDDYIRPNETTQQEWAKEIPLHLIGVEYSPANIRLSKSSITLTKGGSFNLRYTVTPSAAQGAEVEWSTSNSAVASVSSSGKVTAKGNGTAVITCETYNGRKDTCTVKVTTLTNKIELSDTSLKMYTTQKKTLKATVKPSSASNKELVWSSNNTNVATVSSSGKITAVGKGSATITCKTKDGGAAATCIVTVTKKISVKDIELNKSSKTVYKGNTYQLVAEITPVNASNKKVTWKSSNTSVATVSSSGKVTAKKNGTAKIMATTDDGNLVATCKIKVKTKVTGVSLPSSAKAYIGKTTKLTASIKPSSASNKEVTWKSSNKNIATVSSKGVVKGKKSGTVTITVTTKDGSYKDTCKVTVSKYIKVKDVDLNVSSKKLNVGEKYTLKATVSPSNASVKSVTWKSSDTSVAKVSSSGKITAVGKGTATITCTTKDGKVKDKCKVTVKTVKVKSLKLSESTLRLMVGDSDRLTATIKPTNATNKNVTWKSSNTAVAKVSSKGKVTGMGRGTATITCTTKDGKFKKTCKVTVYGVPTDDDQKVMGVKLNKSALTLKAGKTQTLYATVLPQNAANQMVTWSSSNKSVATVSKNGKVTAVKPGKALISVKTADGGWKTSCVVTVE